MDELASITALFNEAKNEMEQAKNDKEELEELREIKSDIDRKDKQNAMIIENQVRRPGCGLGRTTDGLPAGQPRKYCADS
jgi:hypothetical protein